MSEWGEGMCTCDWQDKIHVFTKSSGEAFYNLYGKVIIFYCVLNNGFKEQSKNSIKASHFLINCKGISERL